MQIQFTYDYPSADYPVILTSDVKDTLIQGDIIELWDCEFNLPDIRMSGHILKPNGNKILLTAWRDAGIRTGHDPVVRFRYPTRWKLHCNQWARYISKSEDNRLDPIVIKPNDPFNWDLYNLGYKQ